MQAQLNGSSGRHEGTRLRACLSLFAVLVFLLTPAAASACLPNACSSPHPATMNCDGPLSHDCSGSFRPQQTVTCCALDSTPLSRTKQNFSQHSIDRDLATAFADVTALNVSPKSTGFRTRPGNLPRDRYSLFCTLLI